LSREFVAGFVIFFCALFVFAASQLNRLTLALSPIALAVVLGYSYTKRFTRWSHLVLGFALGIAPAAAWIAIRGSLDVRILLLTGAVTFWVGGFDVLYACQDYEFDCSAGLHSVPRYWGIPKALFLARLFHAAMLGLLIATVVVFHLGIIAMAGVAVVAVLLAWEHSLVKASDLSRMNAAFFTMNGVISVVLFVFIAADVLLRRP
jgi:4-hydroxybenzoate polyprenyltransferase